MNKKTNVIITDKIIKRQPKDDWFACLKVYLKSPPQLVIAVLFPHISIQYLIIILTSLLSCDIFSLPWNPWL